MAKITITIEDQPNGQIRVTPEPLFSHFMKKINAAGVGSLTEAEVLAIFLLNQTHAEFARNKAGKKSPIIIPRVWHSDK